MASDGAEAFTIVELMSLRGALRWQSTVLGLQTSTLEIRLDHLIDARLDAEVEA